MEIKYLLAFTFGYFAYLLSGAGVFSAIERPVETKRCSEAQLFKESLLNRTRNQNITRQELDQIIENINTYYEYGITLKGTVKCPNRWNFQGAFFFVGTIITTIGYGNITPSTPESQAFCVIYALLGIPLFGIMFAGYADLFSRGISKLARVVDDKDIKPWLKNMFIFSMYSVIGFSLFCCIPSAIFSAVEKWSYGVSMYYSVITLTTIGFGDYVAGSNPDQTYIPLYRIMVYFWILFGLAFMATFLNLISERIKLRAASRGKDEQEQSNEEDANRITEEKDGFKAEQGNGFQEPDEATSMKGDQD